MCVFVFCVCGVFHECVCVSSACVVHFMNVYVCVCVWIVRVLCIP